MCDNFRYSVATEIDRELTETWYRTVWLTAREYKLKVN